MQWVRERIVGTTVREVRVTRLYGVRLRTLTITQKEKGNLGSTGLEGHMIQLIKGLL